MTATPGLNMPDGMHSRTIRHLEHGQLMPQHALPNIRVLLRSRASKRLSRTSSAALTSRSKMAWYVASTIDPSCRHVTT